MATLSSTWRPRVKIYLTLYRKTEKWTINEKGITKELLNLELNDYSWYPEVFVVKQNYCTFVWKSINYWRINFRISQQNRVTYIYQKFNKKEK